MRRGPIRRVITEHTTTEAVGPPWLYHHVRFSLETTAGAPTTCGVYHVPDDEWVMLMGLVREAIRKSHKDSPRSVTNYVSGVATQYGWSAHP